MILPLLVCLSLPFLMGHAYAIDSAAQANNPLANMTAFNIQNYYIGELSDTHNKDGNQFILRYAKPFSIGKSHWLMRASAPVNSLPVGSNMKTLSGLGDADVFAAYLFDTKNPAISFGVGPSVVAPTAAKGRLGSEQWQAGAANVYFNATSSKFQFGYLAIYRSGVGNTNDRARVNSFAFQPFGFYQLQKGWYTGTAPTWAFNLANGDYAMPVGLRLGKVIKKDKTVYNFFVEPQASVAHSGPGQAIWQIFFALNMQFM